MVDLHQAKFIHYMHRVHESSLLLLHSAPGDSLPSCPSVHSILEGIVARIPVRIATIRQISAHIWLYRESRQDLLCVPKHPRSLHTHNHVGEDMAVIEPIPGLAITPYSLCSTYQAPTVSSVTLILHALQPAVVSGTPLVAYL